MASTVPRVAAEWMVFHMPGRQGQDNIVDHLETSGLRVLNVKELKHLGDILYSMVAVIEEVSIWSRRLPSSAKKQRRIDFLRRGLFRDDLCTIVNERLMRDMRSETRTSSPATTTARSSLPVASSSSVALRASNSSASAASSTDSRKRPNHEISQHRQPQEQQNTLSAEDATAIFSAYYMSQFNPPVTLARQYHPIHDHGRNLWAAGINHETTNEEALRRIFDDSGAAAADTSPSSATDPDSTPQNSTEAFLLQQLLQMGFKKQEILDGIRQCRSGTTVIPSADEVMLHLVSQREEAEEARREDEVRLRSEDQKQEESQRREQTQQESLSKATTGKDLREIFPESWVLTVLISNTTDSKANNRSIATILHSDSRKDFLEFLKLEERSRKWYGWVLPSGYFLNVGKRLINVGDNEPIPPWATTYLCSEREKLRCGLYELKEQLKGQPKIFLEERPVENGGSTEIVIIDDDDD